jgi:hypothetical protein
MSLWGQGPTKRMFKQRTVCITCYISFFVWKIGSIFTEAKYTYSFSKLKKYLHKKYLNKFQPIMSFIINASINKN